jgi:hypothetical protein
MIDKILPKTFVTDKDERLIKPGEMVEAQNVTIVERGEGSDFVIKTMAGNTSATPKTTADGIQGSVEVIGQVADDQRGFLYVFVKGTSDSNLDAIYQYNESDTTYKEVLKTSRFNFRSGSVSFVKADVLNKSFQRDGNIQTVLYFTDNINPPRKINVDRALSGEYDNNLFTADDFDTALGAMRCASVKPPTFAFDTDTNTTDNNFEQNAMQFATQIVYKDGEVSTLSPYSKLAISQAAVYGGIEDANFGVARSTQNVCLINHQIDNDFPDMEKVRILARSGNTGSFFVVDEFDPKVDLRRNINATNTVVYDASTREYKFFNDGVGRLVPDSESQKLYDNVPQKAGAQSITASRLMYGDYEEGYPNHSIHTDATMSVVYGNTPGGSTQHVANNATAAIFDSANGDMDIDLNLEAGSPNTITSSTTFDAGTQFRASFTYTPDFVATAASTNLIAFSGQVPGTGQINLTMNAIDFTALTLVSAPTVEISKLLPNDMNTDNLADFIQSQIEILGEFKARFQANGLSIPINGGGNLSVNGGFIDVFFTFGEETVASSGTTGGDHVIRFKPRITNIKFVDLSTTTAFLINSGNIFAQTGAAQSEINYTSITNPSSNEFLFIESVGSTPSFKAGANHEFGIVYHDKYGRTGNVNELGSIYVKALPERGSNERGNAAIRFNLSSTNVTAPSWATGYQIVYGGSSIADSFQYAVGGGFARRLKTSVNDAAKFDVDTSVHNIYVSLETLSQYQRDKKSLRDYSFTKGDKLRIIAKRNANDNDFSYVTSSQSKLMEFDVVGYETLDETPIKIQTAAIAEDENNPYKGKFLVLTAPAVEGTAANTSSGDVNQYDGFDWYHVTGTNYNGSVTQSAVDNQWGQGVLVEIFTPKVPTAEKVYYEIGERKPLLVSGRIDAAIGSHGPAFTVSSGDVRFRPVATKIPTRVGGSWPFPANINPATWIYRTVFLEDPAITDLYESTSWDQGRAHTVFEDAATVRRQNSITYSDAYAEDSARLTLSQFTPSLANFFDLPSEDGKCSYLCNMSDMLMAIQENKVSRLSVNKSILSSAEGGGFVGLNTNVLNLLNRFDETLGTSNPESVLIYDGVGYFFDKIRYKAVQFNPGAIQAISDIGIKSSFEATSESFLKGTNPKVVSGYDPVDDIYYITFHPVSTHLPSGRTLAYNTRIKGWQGEYTFVPEHYGTLKNKMLLLDYVDLSGTKKFIHLHGTNTSSNLFYTSASPALSKVTVISNSNPSKVKAYEAISIEGQDEWTTTLESSFGQTTGDLVFSKKEGTYYANVTGDTSANSFRHFIPVGKVASTDGSTITMQNSLRGVHIPTGYTIFKAAPGAVPATAGVTVSAVNRSAKTITASGSGHGLGNADVLYVAGSNAVNGDQIRGHYCKIKCIKTPTNTSLSELYAINAKVSESKHNHG